MKHPIIYFLFFSLFYLNNLFSQSTIIDSSLDRPAVRHIIQLYTDSLKENLRLYYGTEFTGAYRSSAGHPFFENQEPQNGQIFYDGLFYNNVRLRYDLIHDEVIFVTPENDLNIKLISQKISWFVIPGHLFINVTKDDRLPGLPAGDFFELVNIGPYSLLIKRKKQLYQPSKAEENSKFILSNDYFLKRDSICYSINSKRSLLAFCKDRKRQVSKFMQERKMNFKKDPENTIRQAIDYYSKLKI